jgi:hypothetical protein
MLHFIHRECAKAVKASEANETLLKHSGIIENNRTTPSLIFGGARMFRRMAAERRLVTTTPHA